MGRGASLLVALGVLVGVGGSLLTRRRQLAVPTMLDIWTGAGLLRLSADGTWQSAALAAAVVGARQPITRRRPSLAPSRRTGRR